MLQLTFTTGYRLNCDLHKNALIVCGQVKALVSNEALAGSFIWVHVVSCIPQGSVTGGHSPSQSAEQKPQVSLEQMTLDLLYRQTDGVINNVPCRYSLTEKLHLNLIRLMSRCQAELRTSPFSYSRFGQQILSDSLDDYWKPTISSCISVLPNSAATVFNLVFRLCTFYDCCNASRSVFSIGGH